MYTYTLREIEEMTGICVAKLRLAVNRGELDGCKSGRCYYIPEESYQRFKKEHLGKHAYKKEKGNRFQSRKWTCTHYDECLMKAARDNVYFGCDGCTDYVPDKAELDSQQLGAMLALWKTVFSKDVVL
jgi:hypothetical protein